MVKNNFSITADQIEAAGGDPTSSTIEPVTTKIRGVLPDVFGNNVKGERICSVCGIKESETLLKNPRYSFCKGKCVFCYGKTERKVSPESMTIEQIQSKIDFYTDLLLKQNGTQGLSERNAITNPIETTSEDTIVTLGANVGTKDYFDDLAVISE